MAGRFHQLVLIVSLQVVSWLGMQAVHEVGHVLGAWATGGRVEKVIWHPLTISRTDLQTNPHPLAVAWAGPIVGAMLPLLLWMGWAVVRLPGAYVVRYFAGFCLVANGLYLGGGSFAGVGDCGDMLRHGSSLWHLWLFAAATTPLGLLLWNGQGRHFGLGTNGTVNRTAAYIVLALSVGLVLLSLG